MKRGVTSRFTYFESDLFYFMTLYLFYLFYDFTIEDTHPRIEETKTVLFQVYFSLRCTDFFSSIISIIELIYYRIISLD